MKPATGAGFTFLNIFGGKPGALKHFHYKPAKLYEGDKWYVYYSVKDKGVFKRVRVYQGINAVKDLNQRREYANTLIALCDYWLERGESPFKEPATLTVSHKTVTFVDALNRFKTGLRERGLRHRTVQSYESVIRGIYDGMREVLVLNLKDITRHHLSAYLRKAASKNKWSNATYNNNLTFIRAIFNYFIEQDLLEINPAARVKPIPQTTTKNRYYDEETFKKIQDNAPSDLWRFMMFLYHTGTRPNEARQLRYEDIDRQRKLLRIPASISKNKKDDYVPLSEYVLDNFKGSGHIFGSSVNFYTQKFTKLKKELGLPKEVTMYAIKHTRAIHLAQDGADPYSIMQLFRHSGLDITMAYLRDLGVNVNRAAADLSRKF